MRRNQRRYGGYIVHAGVVLLLVGVSGAAFNEEKLENVRPGDSVELHDFRLHISPPMRSPRSTTAAPRRASRSTAGDEAAPGDDARETHVLAGAAAELDPGDLFELARGSLRDPDRRRAGRFGHAQDPSQPARELGLGRGRHLRRRLPDRSLAPSGTGQDEPDRTAAAAPRTDESRSA